MDPKIITDRLARKNPQKTNKIVDRFFDWMFKNTFKIGLWVTVSLIIIGAALQDFNIDIDPKPAPEQSEEAKAEQEKLNLERQKKLTTWDSTEKSPTRRMILETEYDSSKKEAMLFILGGHKRKGIGKGNEKYTNDKSNRIDSNSVGRMKMYKNNLTIDSSSSQSQISNLEPEVNSSVVLTCGSKVNLEVLGFGDLESYKKYTKPKKETIIVGKDVGKDAGKDVGKDTAKGVDTYLDYSKYFSNAIGTEYIDENVTVYYPSKKIEPNSGVSSYKDILVKNVKITGVSPFIKIQPYWYYIIMRGEPICCESSIRLKYRITDAGDKILFEGTTPKFTIGNGSVPYQLEKAAFATGLNGKFVTLLKSKDLRKINVYTGVTESAVKFTPSYVNKNETIMIECSVQAGDQAHTHNNVGSNSVKIKRGVKNTQPKKDTYRQLKNF